MGEVRRNVDLAALAVSRVASDEYRVPARSDTMGRKAIRLAKLFKTQFEADIQTAVGGNFDRLETAKSERGRIRCADIELDDIGDGMGMRVMQLDLRRDPVAAEFECKIRLPKRAIAQAVSEGVGVGLVRSSQ